jgi:hypothetical protein
MNSFEQEFEGASNLFIHGCSVTPFLVSQTSTSNLHQLKTSNNANMTLTVVVGSSGSGKTTFLNDTAKSHHSTYIRQYHSLRPYITVSKIPNFDPTRLPFWDTYVTEGKADTIKVGGTMAGEFTGTCGSFHVLHDTLSSIGANRAHCHILNHSWPQWRSTQIATL